MAAIQHMTKLLVKTNGIFTWENYGRVWETNHRPFRMKNINLMSEDSVRRTHHYSNMKPRFPHENKGDRHADSESGDDSD